MEFLFALLLALAIDASLGEPPRAINPVVWIGKGISLLERFAPIQSKRAQLLYGIFMVLLTIIIFALPVYFLLFYVKQIGSIAYIIGSALLLKPSFSLKELRRSALEIKVLLSKDNLEDARAKMPALVSREAQNLEKPALVSATVESVAENICDSFVAPLFYFLLLGVPGAIAYRVVNTSDAMIGYHGKYEYLGKFSAKLDDVLNFIPARISGLLLVVAAYAYRKDGRNAWRTMLRDHGRTESPNAGWSMSAAAGALSVRLEKAGCYCLGQTSNPLSPQLIASGMNLATIAAILWVLSCLILEVTYFVFIA
ncbi:MAG: cobalamin biosynthesis protein [Dehalococcoidia bacterium]|nr:cobalamin biosynthesis protein [Dehalococcoidia bacterium]